VVSNYVAAASTFRFQYARLTSMLILVTYDVATADKAGQRRLRNVAKKCLNFGQRVQNSVFECSVNNEQFVHLKQQLVELINMEEDSLRFYMLGNEWHNRVEHFGVKPSLDLDEPLIF
jgi:CRISPR-associated protein Cas2